jgi:hypothetical protein
MTLRLQTLLGFILPRMVRVGNAAADLRQLNKIVGFGGQLIY